MLHNGSVTRAQANVGEACRMRHRSLPFSLSAAPSPAADTTSGRRHGQRSGHFGRRGRAGRPDGTRAAPDPGRADRRPRPSRRRAGRPAAPSPAPGGLPIGAPSRFGPDRSVAVRAPRADGPPAAGIDRRGDPERASAAEGVADRPVGLLRRIALWGAGPRGEYLAWPGAFPRPAGGPATRAAAHAPGRFSALIRRAALWGAGPRGEYLAWSSRAGRPAPSIVRAESDSPVLLRELPSTPTVQRAAPSPAAALVPAGPASSPTPRLTRGAPTVAGCSPPGPSSPAPSGWSPAPTGWPQPRAWRPSRQGAMHSTPPSPPASHSRSSSLTSMAPVVRSPSSSPAAGTVRTRGAPSFCPVRGSPPPERRSRPSTSSVSSSFPAQASSPPPCQAPFRPG